MKEIPEYPFVAMEEMILLDKLFEERKPKICFEYGSGGSTVYFSHWFEKLVSLEHDKEWYNSLLPKIPNNVELILEENVEKYINYPIDNSLKFDFIFIDGIERTKCADIACKSLNPHGFVILHDWVRSEYFVNPKLFKHSKVLADGAGGGNNMRGLKIFWND